MVYRKGEPVRQITIWRTNFETALYQSLPLMRKVAQRAGGREHYPSVMLFSPDKGSPGRSRAGYTNLNLAKESII